MKISFTIFATVVAITLVVILALLVPALTKWTLIIISVLLGRFSMFAQAWVEMNLEETTETERKEEQYEED